MRAVCHLNSVIHTSIYIYIQCDIHVIYIYIYIYVIYTHIYLYIQCDIHAIFRESQLNWDALQGLNIIYQYICSTHTCKKYILVQINGILLHLQFSDSLGTKMLVIWFQCSVVNSVKIQEFLLLWSFSARWRSTICGKGSTFHITEMDLLNKYHLKQGVLKN